jgi:hypothetical protein
MAFNDNSGDIILDAVLTEIGREALARGDGSFKIVGFALGDDEINYADWDATASSATAGATIRQTPIFEAITKNTAALKHRLITFAREDLLYLSATKINDKDSASKRTSLGGYVVAVDKDTKDKLMSSEAVDGFLDGFTPLEQTAHIRLDQGLDTLDISYTQELDTASLTHESDWEVQVDNRLVSIVDINGALGDISQIDEDNVAFVNMHINDNDKFVEKIDNTTDSKQMVIAGPRGTALRFKLKAQDLVTNSSALMQTLGITQLGTAFGSASTESYYTVDTVVRVVGKDTGNVIDIPVKLAKWIG